MVLDIEGSQPALLAHGDRNEIPDLDDLRLGKMLVQALPELVIRRQIPGDALRIGKRGLLLVIVARRAFEIDQIPIIRFNQAGLRRLDRTLIAAKLAKHRTRYVDTAELLDVVVGNPAVEHVAPGICEGPKSCGHVSADRLALWTWGAFATTTIEFSQHCLIFDRLWIDVADARCHRLSPFCNRLHLR